MEEGLQEEKQPFGNFLRWVVIESLLRSLTGAGG